MSISRKVSTALIAAFLTFASSLPVGVTAQAAPSSGQYTSGEIVSAGHQFFGSVSNGLASVMERAISLYGLPNGYIIGQEASGAFVGGLRYGEGTLYTKNAGTRPVFWQGPSIGWDFGGDGARTMMLVYDLPQIDTIYRRFGGVNGSAYLVGGVGMTVLAHTENGQKAVYVVPIRTGVGARLGINVGYLKFSDRATWNPF
ncbi:MAG: DUF1134 domain-containing protein [Hyphomicrobiales bacterium]|nr:DUF1134 domain-containing protein [Hyphomicrobiales bacterium]